MVIAAKISVKLGFLSSQDVQIIQNTLQNTGLPTTIDLPPASIMDTLTKDKKKRGDLIDFIALEQIGKAKIIPVKIKELKELFLAIRK